MTELWKGKGTIKYLITIGETDKPEADFPETYWKYYLELNGVGPYENSYLGGESYEIIFLADTKEGLIRDLTTYLDDQILNKKERIEIGLPPDLINIDNTYIQDNTNNNDFKDINIPDIFQNSHSSGFYMTPLPKGEKEYKVVISNDEFKNDKYDVSIYGGSEPLNLEDIDQYDNIYYDELSKNEVIPTIKKGLKEEHENTYSTPPTKENTEILNFTDNPKFTLDRVFNINSLKLLQKSNLNLLSKNEVPNSQSIINRPLIKAPSQLSNYNTNNNERKRMRA